MIAVQCIWCKALVCTNGALDGDIVEEDLVGHEAREGRESQQSTEGQPAVLYTHWITNHDPESLRVLHHTAHGAL